MGGRNRTFTVINALRGFFSKSRSKASSPISGSASGKFDLNHLRVFSLVSNRSNSVVGAKRVQVNVLSYRNEPERGLEYADADMTWKVGRGAASRQISNLIR